MASLNIGAKLAALAGVGLLAGVLVATTAYSSLHGLHERLKEVMLAGQALQNHLEGDMMHDALRGDVVFAFVAETEEERTRARQELAEHAEWFRTCVRANAALPLPTEVRAMIGEVTHDIDQYILSAETMSALALEDGALARGKLGEFEAVYSDLETKTAALSDRIVAYQKDRQDEATASLASAVSSIFGFFLGGVAISGVGAYLISRSISKPLSRIGSAMESLSNGDLTVRLKPKGTDDLSQIGRAVDQAADNMSAMVRQISQAADHVASAATEIASTSEGMSAGIAGQTREIGEIARAAAEMSTATSQVAGQSSEAARSAGESGALAETGGSVVQQTIDGMRQIEHAVQAGAQSVSELGKRGEQIGEIISVINDIADQTNLLALNAAIEAARAGEHGRGFAVVADEVRKLADRTTKATEEIAQSIRAIQQETGQAVSRIEAGTGQVKQGVELATQAGVSLGQIVESSRRVGSMIELIAGSAERQLSLSQSIVAKIESIQARSGSASQGAAETTSATRMLSNKAEELSRMIARFRL
ncbi:MAG: methyl-accepting chemotaxis protein [Planctomycetota bacterium]|nr:methyl-accepting chemotaxis protein [Planctomycetota bacterium]